MKISPLRQAVRHARTRLSALLVLVAAGIALALLASVLLWGAPTAQAQSSLPAPSNFNVVNGPNAGEAILSWNAVTGAAFYRVGWVANDAASQALAENSDVFNHYVYADITSATAYTATGLQPGKQYWFTVAGLSERFGQSGRAKVLSLTLNDDGAVCPVCPVCPTPPSGPGTCPQAPGPTQPPAPPVRDGDYDADNDGLIEIRNLAQLDAMRYDLDGNGASDNDAYAAAYPGAADNMGCPGNGCGGYELVANLDFDTNRNGRADAGDAYWNGGDGWLPIGRLDRFSWERHSSFRTILDGGGHTISNLYISRTSADHVGLFGTLRLSGRIRQLGLVAVNVTGRNNVGGLVGYMDDSAEVTHSYVTGDVIGNEDVGGLVGDNRSSITDSHANGSVSGNNAVGGLTGAHNGGTIARSYAGGEVNASAHNAGGLAGYSSATVNGSYATGDVFAVGPAAGGLIGHNQGTINGSYATGTVTGSDWYVGGLVGEIRNGGTVNGSYSKSSVTGAFGYVGGLVGWNHDRGKINSSYAIGSVTGGVDSEGIGGLVGSNAKLYS